MNVKDSLGIATVVAAFALLSGSTLVLLEAVDALWTNRRFVYSITSPFAAPFGGNRDVPVLVFVGAISGWLLLFWIDATKRVQGALVFLAAAISVGPYLQRTQRVLDAIGRTSWAFVVGVVVGVGSGVLSARLIGADRPTGLLERLQWLRYPGAAAAFRHVATATVGIVLIDYVTALVDDPSTLTVVVAGVVFVLSLSVFLQYGYERRVIALSPHADNGETNYQPYVLGGLYGIASERYGGFSSGSGDLVGLSNARSARSVDQLPSFDDTDTVAFSFSSTRIRLSGDGPLRRAVRFLVPRPVTVESDGLTTTRIGVPESSGESNAVLRYLQFLLVGLRRHVVEIVPTFVRERLPERGRNTVDRLTRADTVLLVGPTPSVDRDSEQWARSFSAVCDRYAGDPGTDVVLATVEAGPVAEAENFTKNDRAFKRRIADRMGIERDDLPTDDIFPIDRFSGDDDRAIDRLLQRLGD
jgi:hypothetical protein